MKDGDRLLEQLREAARIAHSLEALFMPPIQHFMDYWYWTDYVRANKN